MNGTVLRELLQEILPSDLILDLAQKSLVSPHANGSGIPWPRLRCCC